MALRVLRDYLARQAYKVKGVLPVNKGSKAKPEIMAHRA